MDLSPEEQRLHALESYNIIDADISDALDGLVELASNICGAPISLVNLVGASQQVTKARRGLEITDLLALRCFLKQLDTPPKHEIGRACDLAGIADRRMQWPGRSSRPALYLPLKWGISFGSILGIF